MREESAKQFASEVLELGQSLFEIALETRDQQTTEVLDGEAYPIDELQAAANEFFSALRLLMGIEE